MKRFCGFLLSVSLCLFGCWAFVACGGNDNPPEPSLAVITGVTFEDRTFAYDGTEKKIEVTGDIPDGVTVVYENNTAMDAGTYQAKATLTGDAYQTLVLTATLTITDSRPAITGVTFDGATFAYDGTEKKIEVTGNIPDGVTVAYENNTATDAGTYQAKAKLTADAYQTLTLTATLKIEKAVVTGVTFDGATFTYDGTEKTIEVTGDIPDGVTPSYEKNKGTNAGTYKAKVTLTGKNYQTKELSATLVINPAEIVGITLAGKSVEYDTQEHSLAIVGNVPGGVYVKYLYNGQEVNAVSQVGEYTVVVTLWGDNYVTKELTAKLSITSTDEELYSVVRGNSVYFQNALDDYKLYSATNGTLKKVNNDKPQYMFVYDGVVYYYSTSLFSKTIKALSGGSATTLFSVKGEYLTTDGTYVYYAVNNLLLDTDQNGIYRYALNGKDESPVRLTTDKAKYLAYDNGYIYYANQSNNGYLSCIPVTAVDGTSTTLWEEKIEYLIADGGVLYFNSTQTVAGIVGVAAAIRKYTVDSATCVKLTTDAGKYLTKIGSYIYYINNDKLTSTLFGDGIYKVSAIHNADNSLPGTKILGTTSETEGYSSLSGEEGCLYYYKRSNKHFYSYALSSSTETDLMKNFVPPVEEAVYAGAAVTAEYKGEIYYTNPCDGLLYGACLYKYNPTTKVNVKVLSDNVSGVWFNGDYMYYSTSIATNYALFRMNMSTGESVKLNSNRCEHLIFEGEYVYYLEISAGDDKIMKMNLDGTNAVALKDDQNMSSHSFVKVGDDFYYIAKNILGNMANVSKFSSATNKTTDLGFKAERFVISGSTIYYYDANAKALKSCSLAGTNVQTVASGVEINDLCVIDGQVYYSTNGTNVGLYKGTQKISDKVAHGLIKVGNSVYFLNTDVAYSLDYPSHEKKSGSYVGDGKLYCYDGTTATKVS